MQRARSVTGPLRRAHPASGATWNVQVVRGKMSSQCLWHACRALSAGLLLMLLGAAMAVIGYYADTLSVDQEIRGNSTVSVKDEARGFHLNNLSYAGPIVMGFGGFIVVAACVMTFEARDSAAKVTPARPQAMPRPIPRRGPPCAAPARLDQLGVYRLPHVLPLPHALPLAPLYRHRQPLIRNTGEKTKGKARFGSAPDLRSSSNRVALPVAALRRPLRRYALSVDEPPQSAVSASAADSDCGSQSSLALDLHASGACAAVTLRVRDNTRRRPLARQQRLRDDSSVLPTPIGSTANINNAEETVKSPDDECKDIKATNSLSVGSELRASSAPPPTRSSPHPSTPPSPRLTVTSPPESNHNDTCITIDHTERDIEKENKQEMEIQTNAWREHSEHMVPVIPRQVVVEMDLDLELIALRVHTDRITEEELERQIQTTLERRVVEDLASTSPSSDDDDVGVNDREGQPNSTQEQNMSEVPETEDTIEMPIPDERVNRNTGDVGALVRRLSEVIERSTGLALMRESDIDLNTRPEFSIENLERELMEEYAENMDINIEPQSQLDSNTTVNSNQDAEISNEGVTVPETSPLDVGQ